MCITLNQRHTPLRVRPITILRFLSAPGGSNYRELNIIIKKILVPSPAKRNISAMQKKK